MARYDEDDSFETLFPRAPPLANPIYRRRRITVWCSMVGLALAAALALGYFLGLLDSLRYVATDSITRTVLTDMDLGADPCDNFYQYACGGWLKKTPIPPQRSSFSRSFAMDADRIRSYLRSFLDNEVRKKSQSRAGTLYSSCMNDAYSSPSTFTPFEPFAKAIAKATADDPHTIAFGIGELRSLGIGTVFNMYMEGDYDDPNLYTLYLGQGGLGLPNQNYYTRTGEEDKRIRTAYKSYLQALFQKLDTQLLEKSPEINLSLGDPPLSADLVVSAETELALAAAPPEDLTDPIKTKNRVTPLDRTKILINSTLSGWGLDDETIAESRLVMDHPPFFIQFSSMLSNASTSQWHAYMTAAALRSMASSGLLGSELKTESFRMSQTLFGTKEMPEKWKFCYGQVNSFAGESLGYEFVSRKFTEDDKSQAQRLVEEIQSSFGKVLDENDWMDPQTIEQARNKMQALTWKIGYGQLDKLEDITLAPTDYSGNIAALRARNVAKDIKDLKNGTVDKKKWYMLPHEVNAYYDPSQNEMVFPAGILQAPFYSGAYPAPMNYGGIGAVMGHELSHGFDSSGRKYDGEGKLRDWWSRDSSRAFENRTKCVADLYSSYRPDGSDANLNGELTLTENLADMGGIKVAYNAFHSAESESGVLTDLHDTFSDDELFFISYGQTWCSKYEKGSLRTLLEGNPHSPGEFRVQGPLSQFQPFSTAFKCSDKSNYNPKDKCEVW